jgi:hypothetical protein
LSEGQRRDLTMDQRAIIFEFAIEGSQEWLGESARPD